MQVRLQSEIETNSAVSLEMLVDSLKNFLPCEYREFIFNDLGDTEAEGFGTFFNHLTPHFTVLNYLCLEYLINKYGNAKLKEDMSTYSKKVRIFMEETTIEQVIDHEWLGQHDIPFDCFKEVEVHMPISGFEHYSLSKLDGLIKERLCTSLCKLCCTPITKCCLSLIKVGRQDSESGISFHWVLPSILCSNLQQSVIRINWVRN